MAFLLQVERTNFVFRTACTQALPGDVHTILKGFELRQLFSRPEIKLSVREMEVWAHLTRAQTKPLWVKPRTCSWL